MSEMVKVEYWVATYHGTVEVNAEDDDEDAVIIARAKRRLKLDTTPFAGLRYERFVVLR